MAPESWNRQRRKVREIELSAQSRAKQMTMTRRQMRARIARFGEPEIFAWAFTAGLIWASGRGRPRRNQGVTSRRTVMWLANSLLLAWQFITQVRATGAALGLGRSTRGNEAQRG